MERKPAFMVRILLAASVALTAVFHPPCVYAAGVEVILTPSPESNADKRTNYSDSLLQLVLDRTEAHYGKAEVRHAAVFMTRNRVLAELQRGSLLQVADAPTRPDFESRLIPVRIPLRKGILGYRIFLIDGDSQPTFDAINSLDQLRRLRLGSGSQWAITSIFKHQRFNVVDDLEYRTLFEMLASGQIDYFPRGLSEIFDEFDLWHGTHPALRIESKIALYVPLPTYFFVTPKRPDLARRIAEGLEAMIADGSFERHFQHEYGTAIRAARLNERKIFRIDNPDLSPETPLRRKELWYVPEQLAK